jgi:hypothetical protein
MVKNRVFKI